MITKHIIFAEIAIEFKQGIDIFFSFLGKLIYFVTLVHVMFRQFSLLNDSLHGKTNQAGYIIIAM